MNNRDVFKEYGFNDMTSFIPLLDGKELANFFGLDLQNEKIIPKTFSKSRGKCKS